MPEKPVDRDALAVELAELGWKLELSRPDVYLATRQRADGSPAREKSASSPEKLLDRVREYERDLEARGGGPKALTIKRGSISTADLQIRRES